jgi:hypothetical protein
MSLVLLEKLMFVELVNKFPKVNNCVHKNPPQEPFLGLLNPIHTLTPYMPQSLK